MNMISTGRLATSVLLGALLAVGCWFAPAQAQPDPMRWGGIPADQLQMTSYPDDPDASAVVLGSFGNLRIGDDMSSTYDVHRRIKIFNEAAYEDMGSVEFSYLRTRQQVERIEGQTFVPDGSGDFRRVVLSDADIFEERDGDRIRVRFTMPALEPGAVFEYRYRIVSRHVWMLPSWRFQTTAPTLWSEYRMRFPGYITVNRHPFGPEPDFHIEEIDERPFEPPSQQAGRQYHGGRDHDTIETTSYRWVMTDVPALRDWEHVASIWNHTFGLRFEWAGHYRWDRRRLEYHPRAETWDNVTEVLLDHAEFGRRLSAPRAVRDRAAELVADVSTDADKVQAIYDFVRTSIVWDGSYSLYAVRSLDRVLESRTGSSSEINLLLITLLREAGIAADPVVVATRRYGAVQRWFTSDLQFNHVLAQAQIGRQRQLLDATDRHLPAGMLPVAALNGQGRLIATGRSAWVDLQPAPSSSNLEVDAAISDDGTISGVMTGRLLGYPALFARQRFAEVMSSHKRDDLNERGRALIPGDELRFTEVIAEEIDGDGELTFELHFETEDGAQIMEHLVTLNPILAWRVDANPFLAPERVLPVDFAIPASLTYVARFTLPEGYTVDELPEQARLFTPGNGLTYARIINRRGGEIQVRRVLGRRQVVFEPHDYAALRDVYDGISTADAGVVVLSRSLGSADEAHADTEE